MILTAHQPVYLPWLGLFHKIALADEFCVFNIAQYQKKDFNNRNKIKTASGPLWLSVPVESKNHFSKRVGDIRIIHNGWNRKHLKSISLSYAKAPFFAEYFPGLEHILSSAYDLLTELNTALLRLFLRQLGLARTIRLTDVYELHGAKSDLVLDMCVKLGATAYIFGAQGKAYADVPSFEHAGVTPYFQEYQHPCYSQLHGEFEPYMSIVDLLFNEGPHSLDFIMRGNARTLKELQAPL